MLYTHPCILMRRAQIILCDVVHKTDEAAKMTYNIALNTSNNINSSNNLGEDLLSQETLNLYIFLDMTQNC